jgi:hypothetical protein
MNDVLSSGACKITRHAFGNCVHSNEICTYSSDVLLRTGMTVHNILEGRGSKRVVISDATCVSWNVPSQDEQHTPMLQDNTIASANIMLTTNLAQTTPR